MAHIALYRTWRPQAFRDMVGQQHITQTLQNALREGRMSHAYLFNGPRGTGKTSAAKILAKAVNCERGPAEEPCNECSACRRITDGAVMDVIEIDAASNRGVEEIRDIRDKAKYAPTEVRQKVYIIDEVHMLTTEAFNALLKTLEEPPGHVMFILATTEPHKLPATIISRCQRFDFRRVGLEEQVARLRHVCERENVSAEPEAIEYIARLSDGGMRDALSVLDQIIAYTGAEIKYEAVLAITGGIGSEQFARLAGAVAAQDIGACLGMIETFMQEGRSAEKCMENLIYYFRDMLMLKLVPNAQHMTDRVLDARQVGEWISRFSTDQLFQMIETLNRYQTEMKYSAQPQTMLEIAIMKLCTAGSSAVAAGGAAAVAVQPAAASAAAASSGAGAGAGGAGTAAAGELAALRQKVEQMERQLSKLLQGGGAAASTSTREPEPARSIMRSSSSGGGGARSTVKLDVYVTQPDSALLQQALGKWSQVLQQVKERKITVHAWLVDGELVSAAGESLLLAFKSAMHRETTEKPAHRDIIEQVIAELFGQRLKLVTVMMKDWKDAQAGAQEPPEEMKLDGGEGQAAQPKEQWVEEAVQLFGEDLVVIKD
ncbi:DNA polymerase III subunit gamma/tau [Paenibacillus koleovorans]|uniref:DNA polymerase III subunit gamma/tau n=1 Tax=Paenibacillus koleovorans TaxID=121608 RepID=UPI000FDBEF5C|nr:DNA polymerase III subunit gamma/tau [Paenibacillus koleovorans]